MSRGHARVCTALITLAVLWSLPLRALSQAANTRTDEDAAGAIDEYAHSAASLGFSGTLLVARGGKLILHRGYGWADQTRRVPNDTSTVFYIASLSKQFTATAVLLLEAQGKLKTSDKINLYLKDVPVDKTAITIHQLLTHTSGLGRFGWDNKTNDWSVMGRDEAVSGLLHSPLSQQPGAKYSYTNSNYILLAAIVEAVSGATFPAFVRDNLLRPAGVTSALFGAEAQPQLSKDDIAVGYSDGARIGSYFERPKSWLRTGAADMLISVGDLYRWIRALRAGKILPSAQYEKLFTIQATIEPGLGYSYGWSVRQSASGKRVIFHRGDFNGFHCEFRWYPESDLTLIVATNNEFRGTSITETLLNHAIGILRGQGSPLPHVITLGPQELRRYASTFYLQSGTWLEVSAAVDHLEIEAPEPSAAEILANDDPAGARERLAYGNSTLNLIARLKRGERDAYADVLAPPVRPQEREFNEEWNSLPARLGELRSYQILSTVHRPDDDASVSYVRLNFNRGSTVMGFAWNEGKLQYTLPKARPEPGRLAFVPISPSEFMSYDWRSEELLKATFESDPTGVVQSLTILGRTRKTSTLTKVKPSRGKSLVN